MANELVSRVRRSIVIAGLTIGDEIQTVAADLAITFRKTIPAQKTDEEVAVTVDVSEVRGMGLVASQDCTIKTNDPQSPGNTLELLAKQPLIWMVGDPSGNKFLTTDVTAFYVTTGSSDTILAFGAAVDATPTLAG